MALQKARRFIWTRFLSRLPLGRAVEAELAKEAGAGRRPGMRGGAPGADPAAKTRAPEYRPEIFDATDMESARAIILTPEAGTSTRERWTLETPFLIGAIGREFRLDKDSCVLDYGCGIGRVAKGLIERHGCSVVGVDISAPMRRLALEFVNSDRFMVCAPAALDALVARGFRATHACALWTIQHCLAPDEDLARIESSLIPGGKLYILNLDARAIPTTTGWISDGISVEDLLVRRFDRIEKGKLPPDVTTLQISESTYTMILRKRG